MVLAGILFAVLTAFMALMIRKGYTEEEKPPATVRRRIQYRLEAFTRGCERLLGGSSEARLQARKMNEALLISEEERFKRAQKLYVGMWVLLMLGCAGSGILAWQAEQAGEVERIHRPEFGQETQVILKVIGMDNIDEVRFSVSGRQPGETEMDAVFDRAFEDLKQTMLNGNDSFDAVRKSLEFPEELETGIRAEYMSSDPEVMSNRGFLTGDVGAESGELSERSGSDITITVTLFYREQKKVYELPIRVLPEQVTLTDTERLEEMIRGADADSRDSETLNLPTELDGARIGYREEAASPYPMLVLAIGAAGGLYAASKEKVKKKYEQRSEELEESFPGMLSKISTLISAGMSIRSAWVRVAEDYRAGVHSNTRRKEYVYEEMLITAHQLMNGQAEGEAYVKFGKRCGRQEYVRFGNILSKNLRQGISGLHGELKEEMERALTERKTNALRRGEIAGTKMLFPMILMLGVVLVTVAAPAFLAF